MTDTKRSLSALQTLLADNVGGAISPQDMRDLLVSVYPYGAPSYVLAAAASAADTAITLDRNPPVGMNSRSALLAIEPFSANCELRRITGLSSATVTLNSALILAHAQDADVLFLPTSEASPALFGMLCDDSTNEWQKCQRMFIQARQAECGIVGPGGLQAVASIRIHQPLLISSTIRAREIAF